MIEFAPPTNGNGNGNHVAIPLPYVPASLTFEQGQRLIELLLEIAKSSALSAEIMRTTWDYRLDADH